MRARCGERRGEGTRCTVLVHVQECQEWTEESRLDKQRRRAKRTGSAASKRHVGKSLLSREAHACKLALHLHNMYILCIVHVVAIVL